MTLTVEQALGEAEAAAEDLCCFSDAALIGEFIKRRRSHVAQHGVANHVNEQTMVNRLAGLLGGLADNSSRW